MHLFAITLVLVSTGVHAQTQVAAPPRPTASASAAVMADGEVRKIDKDAGKLTLRHGRIENLDMPGMTMVFRVTDPKMLDGLKDGDKVRFAADRTGGAFTVTRIEVVNYGNSAGVGK